MREWWIGVFLFWWVKFWERMGGELKDNGRGNLQEKEGKTTEEGGEVAREGAEKSQEKKGKFAGERGENCRRRREKL